MMSKDALNVCHLNVNHLYNKVPGVAHLINTQNDTVHIMGITESMLDERMDNENLAIMNYSVIRRDAFYDRHRGIAVYINNTIYRSIKRRTDLEIKEVESIFLEIEYKKSDPSLICILYRNPDEPADWRDHFENMISNISYDKYSLQILGDFNIDLNKPHLLWKSTVMQLGLEQLVKENTRVNHISQTMIDHIYTNNKANIIDSKVIKTGISDHFAIYFSFRQQIVKRTIKGHTCIKYRCYKRFDANYYTAELSQVPFKEIYNITEPNLAIEHLSNLLTNVIDRHAPLKSKRVKHPNTPPWLSNETLRAMDLRDLYDSQNDSENYRKQRNKVNTMVETDRKAYFDKLLIDEKDTATIWKAMNSITNASQKKRNHQNIEIEPDTINDFFLNLANSILTPEVRNASEKYECPQELVNHCSKSKENFSIPYLTVLDVGKLITNLKNSKSLGPDNIPVYLLKLSLPFIVEELTYIYNLCIDKCIFPKVLKEAKVIPLPKSKETKEPQNFRPISLLPVLSKPFEKHIHKHMYSHLQQFDLIQSHQSGFRPKHSCQTALTRLVDSWLTSINNKQLIGSVFLDFKKAFDLVNHEILLQKLSYYFPKSPIIYLMNSYLTDRYQFVYLNGKQSNTKLVQNGVPQGSVLGPLFFLMYINDLPLHLNDNIENDLFADDASLHTSHTQIDIIQNNLQDSLDKASEWCSKNSMIIHPEKTKSMVITTRQKRQLDHPTLNLKLGETDIEQVDDHKILGLTIDSNLTWNIHIESLIKRISRNIFLLTKLKKYTTTKNLKLFFDAQIMSYINYASTIHDGCSQDTFINVNAIHRKAVRHLINNPEQQTDEKLKTLNILPLAKQYEYNKIVLVHKIYHEMTPSYLNNLIRKAPNRYHSKSLILPLPRIDLFKNSLSFSGAALWNALPNELKAISSLKSFKTKLLKHLHEIA